jgi:hypothetical protein
MWCHGTVAELLGGAGLCRCARMPDAAYVQVTDCYWWILLKKSKIERLRKSREGRLLGLSAAARLFKTNRTVDILAERAAGRVKTSIACGYQLSLRA